MSPVRINLCLENEISNFRVMYMSGAIFLLIVRSGEDVRR